jgi:hypothetical protein
MHRSSIQISEISVGTKQISFSGDFVCVCVCVFDRNILKG